MLTAPALTVLGENAMVMPGRPLSMVRLALAAPTLPALVDRLPVVFTWVPGVLLVTSRLKVQVAFLLRR